MLKKLSKKNRRIYWTITSLSVFIIINAFFEKEIQTPQDLFYRDIEVSKIQNIRYQKRAGNSIAIIDSKNDEYRITLKTKSCLTQNIKAILKPNDKVIVGITNRHPLFSYFLPYYETFTLKKNQKDYIDFECISNESRFGKRKLTVILIILNIIILYMLYITQKPSNQNID